MKRYSSIDFLRGLAIFIMLFLHIISHVLDVDSLMANINNEPLINIVALVILPYLGGLAGFFLMVSAIGNMISMSKYLKKDNSPDNLIVRQVVGGFLLLIFAMLTEGVIGYWGSLGHLFRNLDNPADTNWQVMLYRGYTFETIHTIAWCIIVNGLVQGLLVKIFKNNMRKIILSYVLLSIIVVALTPVLWSGASYIAALDGNAGYPFGVNPVTGVDSHSPYLTKSPWYDFILYFFLNPIAGRPEPIFPYLATSFVGSIIGLYISQDKKSIRWKFLKKIMILAFITFWVGTVGIILNIVAIMENAGFDQAIDVYRMIWDHRYWVPENGVPYAGWLFQFLSLNGFAACGILIVIRLVEFRGFGAGFAKKSRFIRRFGFIA
ncbi:MAG: hypothetical protein ACTSRA_21195, partial [Promethearchaeota archaeon]